MKNPYKRICVNGKNIDEHRHIMQELLGRKLGRFEYIHHINGDKMDNRIENLVVMCGQEHAIEHNQKYPISKKCVVCGKEFIPHKTKRERAKTCTIKCYRELIMENASKRKIPIIQLDLSGNEIKRWDSARDIQKELGYFESNINKCCKGKIKTAYGYKWVFARIIEQIKGKI